MNPFYLKVPVIGILRGVDAAFFTQIVKASFASGLQALEVTMNTDNVLDMIVENRPSVPEGCYLGIGTVCRVEEAVQAIDAGAMFLVTPNLDLEVIEYARGRNIPVVAGALTPTEVYAAAKAGAAMVKVFPCNAMGGPGYIKDLRGPFDDIALVAVGGVTVDTLDDYLKAGVQAVGVSTALFGREALRERDIHALTRKVKDFVSYFQHSS